ncbi:MAG: alcohol dehydrogenase catalytic domain-containing protein [Spirochaetales bacterium]|nr:alcohol dehydrogenase catalytic domain-containing protein [Spirochaetales bacterium]
MLACVYRSARDLVLENRPIPRAGESTAVIKVRAGSICGTDLRAYLHGSSRIQAPRIIGHEVSGEIVEAGRRVEGFAVADRVTVAPAIGCGRCYACRRGYTNLCDDLLTIGFQCDGGFAEFMEIPGRAFSAGHVNRLPEGVSFEEASLAEPIACVLNGQSLLNIRNGDTVVVFGAGFIGCVHAELAGLHGAVQVFMVEPNQARLDEALRLLPSLRAIAPANGDVVAEALRLTEGRGIDVAITACPSGRAQADAIAMAAKRGRVSLFGGLPGDSKCFVDSNVVHYKELSVVGAHASTAAQNRQVLEWIAAKTLNVEKYISRIYPLDQVEQAFEDLKAQRVSKVILRP